MKLNTLRFFQLRQEQSLLPITASNASVILGISRREFLSDVADLNREGFLILSKGNGFAFRTGAELEDCKKKLKSMAISILDRLAAIDKVTRKESAQQLLIEFEPKPSSDELRGVTMSEPLLANS